MRSIRPAAVPILLTIMDEARAGEGACPLESACAALRMGGSVESDDARLLAVWERVAVADSPFAAAEDILAVCEDPDPQFRYGLAELRALPIEAVRVMSRDDDVYVRMMLASNKVLDPRVAAVRDELLALDAEPDVRALLLELDLDAPLRTRVLATLAPEQICWPQPWMPTALLEGIIAAIDSVDTPRGEPDETAVERQRREAVSCLPGDSPMLIEMCSSRHRSAREGAAANPALPGDLRARLAIADPDLGVRAWAVAASLDRDVLARLALDDEHRMRCAVGMACLEIEPDPARSAADRDAARDVLMRLAADHDEWVRDEVARSPRTHDVLLGDTSEYVRRTVAESTHDLLRQRVLSEDPSDIVRSAVAQTSRDPDLLRLLARDPDWDVCRAVPKNPHAPPDLLRELVGHWETAFTMARVLDPLGWSPEARAGLPPYVAGYAEAMTLAHLAEHPLLPPDLRTRLAVHPARQVSDAALAHLPSDPEHVAARALRPRHRRGLLWKLLAYAGAPVEDPHFRSAVLARLPTATGSVAALIPRDEGGDVLGALT